MARKPTEGQSAIDLAGGSTSATAVEGGMKSGESPAPERGTVIVEAGELAKAVRRIRPFASQRGSHPILKAVRMTTEENGLRLTVCNGEQWMTTTVPARADEFDIAVSVADLGEIAGELEGRIKIKRPTAAVVSLEDQVIDARLLAYPAGEFPELPKLEERTGEAKIEVAEIDKIVSQAGFAVSDDMSRAYLTGLFFGSNDKGRIAVATDTHRLAVCPIEFIEGHIDGIVPYNAVRAFPWASAGTVQAYQYEGKIDLRYDGYRLVSNLLIGQYPNWERVVPAEFTRMWTVDRREMIRSIRRAMIYGRDNANRIRFTAEGDSIKVSGRSEDRGEIAVKVPMISKNGQIEIAFNGRYLIDALNACGTDGAVFEMTEPARPAVIRPVADLKPELHPKNFVVVMPMALG